MSHPLQDVKARLDPVKDKSFIDRIAHSKVCQNWNISEAYCMGHKKEPACEIDEVCESPGTCDCKCMPCFEHRLDRSDRLYDSFKENGY